MKRLVLLASTVAVGLWSLTGCGGPRQQPAMMAPPVAQQMPPMNNGGMGGNMGNMGGSMPVGNPQGGAYNWQDVPANQQVGIQRAQFDQGGYQLITDSGDTIIVPFVNQNLYVMKFGRTGGQSYFVNENGAPTLYLSQGFGLSNAAAQGALWYPIPSNYNYTRPMYVGLAPSWSDYMGMGWYPGMMMYGGMWSYNSYGYNWMPGFNINIGGRPYYGWNSYHSYYIGHPGYSRPSMVYRNYNTAPRGTGSYRYTGSFGNNRGTGSFGGGNRTTGSFGSSRPSGTFGSSGGSTGSFGSRPSGTFGSRPTGTFGSGSTGSGTRTTGTFGNGSFGGTRPSGTFGGSSTSAPRGSFGGGGGGFSTPSARPSSGSFGGSSSRPSGGSFGGGSTRSSGSFGGGRRR